MPIPLLEKEVEGPVKKWARSKGIIVVPLKLRSSVIGGFPDVLFLFRGRIAFIEFKAPGKVPDPRQAYWIAKLGEHYFPVRVIDNVRAGIEFLASTFGLGAS